MKKEFLIPKEGVLVRDPVGNTRIPPEGDYRMMNSYYDRRIKDGDLVMRDSDSPGAPPAVVESNQSAKAAGKKADSREGNK